MDLQNTSCRDAHSMHPLVGALQPKNVPSLERQALSLQLLLHQPPCDAPASCVDAKGFASYKRLKSSVLGLFCFVFVCSYIHLVQSFIHSLYFVLSLSVDTTTPSLQHSTSIGINFYSIHFPIVGFISSCWSGITETVCLSVLLTDTVDTDICLLYNKAHCRIL